VGIASVPGVASVHLNVRDICAKSVDTVAGI
jgi:hypothetical protein